MAKGIELPNIPEEEETPLLKTVLAIVEQLAEKVRHQEEEIQRLKDEISILKGEKKRPIFKPSKMDQEAGKNKDGKDEGKGKAGGKRPGSEKKSKTQRLKIHEEKVCKPGEPIPAGSRFKGYRDFVVQDLVIQAYNIRYRLERWETPDGETLLGQLPDSHEDHHFGPELVSYVLYQHHHCQVTQPLLLEQLREWGIDISSGTINDLLLQDKERFHREKDELLLRGLASSSYVTVDDTGARHQGKNGYVTHIGNEFFAWFKSTGSKSRINFLELLRAHHRDYWINDEALTYMQQQRLPKKPLERLRGHCLQGFPDQASWEAHLDRLAISKARHRRIATEGALLGSVLHHGFSPALAIVSDDAGQFNILLHALCWVHAERLVHKLIPLNDQHREDIARVRGQIWSLYADLKTYKIQPTMAHKEELQARFDTLWVANCYFACKNRQMTNLAPDSRLPYPV